MADFTTLFPELEARYNLPPGYLLRTAQIESSLNPNNQSKLSSAGGLFQFIDSTARQYGLKNKFDPSEASDAAARLGSDNATTLRSALGRDPTAAELYLAHQQGSGGAVKLLSNPNAPATSIVGLDAVKNNGGNPNMTAGDFANLWLKKFDKSSAQPTGNKAMPSGMPQIMGGSGEADPGLPPILSGQPQQAGFFQDPMKIAALQMIMQGINPWTKGDPTQTLMQAMAMKQQQGNQAYDRQKDQRDYELRLKQFGLQEQNAQQPQYMTRPDGSVVEIPKAASGGQPRQVLPGATAPSEAAKAAADMGLKIGTTEYNEFLKDWYRKKTDSPADAADERKATALKYGLKEGSPAYQAYVLTGKMPREDQQPLTATDKKAILEADEAVLQNNTVIDALQQAKKLSPTAHTGYLASTRATLGNNLPDWMVPDRVASPASSEATANYENLVLGQALGQLKSTFGAAPTEGERKILLELQASIDKPDSVRQEILDRATKLAQKRLEFSKQKADELRGGSYYKQGGGSNAQPVPSQSAGSGKTSSGMPWKVVE